MTPRRISTLCLIATVLIWSSTYVVTQWTLMEAGPFTINFLRFAIGLAVLIPLAWRQGFRPSMALEPAMIKYGATGVTLFYALQNLGLLLTTAGNAALISALLPGATAVLSVWLLRERLPAGRLAGVVLSVIGVLIISYGQPGGAGPGGRMIVGNVLIIGSMLAWALYTIQGKRLPPGRPPLVVTAASMLAGTAILLPFCALEIWIRGLPAFTLNGVLALLYLGAGASALTMLLWNWAIRYVDATAASLFPNLIPPVGLLIAWAGGEAVGGVQLLGGLLAMVGVWLSERQ